MLVAGKKVSRLNTRYLTTMNSAKLNSIQKYYSSKHRNDDEEEDDNYDKSSYSMIRRSHRGVFGLSIIKQSETGVKTFLGSYTGLANNGLNLYIPFLQKIYPISNRVNQLNFTFKVVTSEGAFISLKIAVQLQIKPEDSHNAFFELDDPDTQVKSFVENVIRSTAPKHKLMELIGQRQEINHEIEVALGERMKKYGFTILNTQILDISPDQKVQDAMNAVISSSRLLEAANNEAEAEKIKLVKAAEADAERRVLQGKGTAGQRMEIMRGYEEGVDEMAKNLGLSAHDVLKFLTRIQELDTFERIGMTNNTKTVFLDTTPKEDKSIDFMKANEVNH